MQVDVSTSEERFRALFEFATEGILVVDAAGLIQLINPAAEHLFGYNNGELLQQPIEVLIPQRYNNKHHQHRANYAKSPHPRNMGAGFDLFGIKKDQTEFPVEVSLSPFSNSSGTFVIAFIIDISIRKKNEASLAQQKKELEELTFELEKRVRERTMILQEALQQLEQSRSELKDALEKEKELNEMKSRFVSMASHEFRTPLATILSSLSLVTKYGELDDKEKQLRHIQRIKSSVTHLTDILNDMLSLSKLEEGKTAVSIEPFNIIEFGEQIVQELQSLTKKEQQIHFEHNGQFVVYTDIRILRNICFNLISNAIKFSPEKSTINITTSVQNDNLMLTIADEGIGISEEDKKHLFERFFRGHNATNIQGTGLGLNIVVRYLELLNGSIKVESKENKGSTFIIEIPNNQTGTHA